MRLVLIV